MKIFKISSVLFFLSFAMPVFPEETGGPSYYSVYENREKVISAVLEKIKNEIGDSDSLAPLTAEFYALVARLNPDDAYFMLLDFYDGLLSCSANFNQASARKKKIMKLLFEGLSRCNDQELTEWLSGRLIDETTAENCDNEMKASLASAFKNAAPSKNMIILLAKAGAEKPFINELKKFAGQAADTLSDPVALGALIALSRAGDNDAAKQLIALFSKTEDASYKVSVLMPDMAYAPAPDVILLLKQYLNSDIGFAQSEAPIQIVPPANYAADALSRMLSGFPAKKDVFSYEKEDIDKCRKWMDSQKEFYYK